MPSAVKNVTVENLLSGRRYLVEWTLNDPTEGVTAYEIYRSTTEYQGFVKIGEVATPTVQYIDKVPYTFGIVHFYKVIARSSTGLKSDITQSNPVQDVTFDSFEETPFRSTTISFNSFAVGEIPTGTKNSVNTQFTLASFFRFNTVQVFVGGLALVRGVGYTENTDQKTITMAVAPAPATVLLINYIKV